MKDIPGFEGKYAITELGEVWSYRSQKFLKQEINGHGYALVWLVSGDKRQHVRVHRLVAENFIPNPEGKTDVDHIDENKTNNCIENLRWVTRSENVKHSWHERRIKARPVRCIELDKKFPTMTAAAKFAGIHLQGITNCLAGKQKTAGGYHWEDAEKD